MTIAVDRCKITAKGVVKMYRLNVNISDEASEVIKAEAKRIGTSMGTIVTLMALDKQKENAVVNELPKMAQYMEEIKKNQATK